MFGRKHKTGDAAFNPAFRVGQRFRAPGGQYYTVYKDMLQQKHLLIAGATGSGKSVLINGLIATALLEGPDKARFILVDPKRVELRRWRMVPHTMMHATEPADMVNALRSAVALIESRYSDMARTGALSYDGSHVYIVIDELADLMTTNKREVLPLLQRICQIGRAARVHVIAATQCPLAAVIPTPVKVNFDSLVALHTATAQHSRNIMDENGCEALPQYGYGYYKKPCYKALHELPMIPEDRIADLINYWTTSRCAA